MAPRQSVVLRRGMPLLCRHPASGNAPCRGEQLATGVLELAHLRRSRERAGASGAPLSTKSHQLYIARVIAIGTMGMHPAQARQLGDFMMLPWIGMEAFGGPP